MKIKLIFPRIGPKITFLGKTFKSHLWATRTYHMPPLGLCYLASLTPNNHEISLVDENFQDAIIEEDDNVIGISVYTPMAKRVYDLCKEIRRINPNAKIILGGYHVSALPYEAIKYCDAVVIGEAEGVWEKVVSDIENEKLKKFYYNPQFIKNCWEKTLNVPIPKRELLKNYKYFCDTIQTCRGCPSGCDFCIIHKFSGRMARTRPLEQVRVELEMLRKKYLGIVDDNLVGDINHAKGLFKLLKEFNFKWFAQTSINVAKDEELLKLAADSGCEALFIGFETIKKENLISVKKYINQPKEYEKMIRLIHDYGIGIEGAFVFGFDSDTKKVFKETLEFVNRNEIEMCQFTILTPLPGTSLWERMNTEKRILTYDWDFYDVIHPVFHPKNMKAYELMEGLRNLYVEFYSTVGSFKRIMRKRGGMWSFWMNADLTLLFSLLKHIKRFYELEIDPLYVNLREKNF